MNRKYPFWLWPNLLSLDAPIIAVAWQEMFARIASMELSWAHRSVLFFATWMIYILDRVLDSLHEPQPDGRPRHVFSREHKFALLIPCAFAFLATCWIAFFRLDPFLRTVGIFGGILILLYFIFIHAKKMTPRSKQKELPTPSAPSLKKETVVALGFSSGVALAPWSLSLSHQKATFYLCILFFALVAFENCAFISKWESKDSSFKNFTRFLFPLTTITALGAFLITFVFPSSLSFFSGSLGLSASILAILDYLSPSMDVNILRILADVALLSPVPFFVLLWI